MTRSDELHVLSGADRLAERGVLTPADLGILQRRIERSLARRTWLTGFASGVASTVLVAMVALGYIGASTPSRPADGPAHQQPEAGVGSAIALQTPPAIVTTLTTLVPCTLPPSPELRVEHRLEQRVEQRLTSQAPQPTPAGDDRDRAPVDASRLRSQLRIFADGERSLGTGAPDRALARARHLRAQWPGGPLEMDAIILEIRALRALAQDHDARRVLEAAAQHPLAVEKAAVLADLRAALLAPPSTDDLTDNDDHTGAGVLAEDEAEHDDGPPASEPGTPR